MEQRSEREDIIISVEHWKIIKNAPPKQPPLNGLIHVEYTTMRNVLAREMEVELGAIFVNFKRGTATRIALIEMGHSQPPTLEVTDSAA